MSVAAKVKLFFFPSDMSKDQDTKKLEGALYVKKPFRVFIDSRPAMLKYKQEVNFSDPKDVSKDKKASAKQITITGWFKRFGMDEYRQLNPTEVKKILGWMVLKDIKPQDLTMLQLDDALASVLELGCGEPDDDKKIVVPGQQKTNGGIIIPGA